MATNISHTHTYCGMGMRDANISPGIRDENNSPYMCEVVMRDNNMSPDMRYYNRSPYFCEMGMRDDMCICVYRSMSMCAYMYIDCIITPQTCEIGFSTATSL